VIDSLGRVAVIHRPRYDDWSLPKGKFEPGEDATVIDCALREVLEETGVRARVTGFAGQTMYIKNGRPKLVLFWDMAFTRAGKFTPNDEIAGIEWLSTKLALKRLTHEDERAVLAAAVRT
jgi:8-oxo-dGTP diphosphatase